LAACSAAGAEITLLSMTHGEEGDIAHDLTTRAGLGATRAHELEAAGRALGAGNAMCLDYPDAKLHRTDRTAAVDALVRQINAIRPDIVISFGPEGL
jgi:LmbE family N-acetylglucosaminyl deacetylase